MRRSLPSAALPTSQLILQPFRCFTYDIGTSPTSPGEPPMPLWWCLIYPWGFCNLQWLRPAGLYERCKLALELKRLKTPDLGPQKKVPGQFPGAPWLDYTPGNSWMAPVKVLNSSLEYRIHSLVCNFSLSNTRSSCKQSFISPSKKVVEVHKIENLTLSSPVVSLWNHIFYGLTHAALWSHIEIITAACLVVYSSVKIQHLLQLQRASMDQEWAELILQAFSHFTYIRAHCDSASFPSLHLRHSSFSNPSLALPTSQDFHLRHLASRPW